MFNIGNKIIEIDGTGKFLGHQFLLKGTPYGSKRCKYCGKWFDWVNEEPQHCGNSACEYFHWRFLKHQAKKMYIDKEMKDFFDNPEVAKKVLTTVKNLWE